MNQSLCVGIVLGLIPVKMAANHYGLSDGMSFLVGLAVAVVAYVLAEHWLIKKRRG